MLNEAQRQLRAMRRAHNIKQAELAGAMRLSQPLISSYETFRAPSPERLAELFAAIQMLANEGRTRPELRVY